MKFLLWFEAERCSAIAPIVKEHPEYFLRTKNPDPNVNLVNLGDDKARGWLLDAVSGAIRTNGVDIYRQDFNMDPAANWADNDTPDRIGVTEIKYINGLYSYWDALRARFNQMLLENCASGGRRMDYEMQSRAHSYCRDDAQMSPHCEELCQNITLNSTAYIPFTGGETFTVAKHDDYGFVSCVAAGTVFTPTDFGFLFREPFTEADLKWFNDMYRIADRVRPFYMGDFYALTEPAVDSSEIWCAWQCDDPVAKAGFFIAFRRARCGQASLALDLGGIDPAREYELEVYGQPDKVRMKGEALAKYVVTLPQPRSFQLVFYKGL
jgi:alpha-galactosidase